MDDMDAGFLDRADFESMGMRMEFQSEERNINRKGHGRGEKRRAPTLTRETVTGSIQVPVNTWRLRCARALAQKPAQSCRRRCAHEGPLRARQAF